MTNLFNRTQPLIRYELTDRFVRQPDDPDGPGSGHVRVTVDGRQDDLLRYADTVIHPLVLRSAVASTPAVTEYQVHQTPAGVDVAVVTNRLLDEEALASRLADALEHAGLRSPEVCVRSVDALRRHPLTGKVKRFVGLPAVPTGPT